MIESKAAITDGKGNFTFETIMVGSPQQDEVLIEMKAAGLCHTDWDSSGNADLVMGHVKEQALSKKSVLASPMFK